MLITSFFTWWWSAGIKQLAGRLLARLDLTRDYFSITLLLKTLFQPFRMIDAQRPVDAPLAVRLRAALDRLVSRLIGGMIRLAVMLFGLVVILLQAILSLIYMVIWLVMPFLPVLGIILFILGVTPTWLN